MRSATEQPSSVVVENDKEKKKNKRRSNRRSKHNSPNLVNEIGDSCSAKSKNYISSTGFSSIGQPDFDDARVSTDVVFNSMPTMHIDEQFRQLSPFDIVDTQPFSNSCPEPFTSQVLQLDGDCHTRGKIFASHWSTEAVNERLENGCVFKALFRVNAHNRLEAYCNIDGVSTDVLINGIAAQNRAVEGDIVVIKVDPLSCWTKMKGSSGPSVNLPSSEDCNATVESSRMATTCKSKQKVDRDHGCTGSEIVCQEDLTDPVKNCLSNGFCPSASDSPHFGSSVGQNEAVSGIDRLCTMICSFPSKRPTGRVVAIIERSSRRDAIVGFLNVKQWLYHKEGCKKDTKKSKNLLLISTHEYIQLTPTDPRFPKMMVLVCSLPDSIKKRLQEGDSIVELELVAAQMGNWDEENPLPQANVSHIFGRASEMEPQISAILYENAICRSDFSPESLSCIPCIPWEVPAEECKSRQDLRSLCIFTVDPSTATDLDDALSIETLPNGILKVGVHMADVSYFVLPDTALDIEAQVRSTSVYMSRQKLPMLPPLLSENLGSLNPGVDKLAFSVFWELNSAGDIMDRWIGRTVIQSCCKLSYEHVQDMIDGRITEDTAGRDLPQLHGRFQWPEVIRSVRSLHAVSKTLREKRFTDGAVLLESSKIGFLFDEYGVPYDSILSESKESNFLVEEFMLLANRTAAEVIYRAFPDSALLRRHPEPNMRKLREFEAFCSKHGLELDTSSSGHFHCSLERIREELKDDDVLFSILMSYASRTMQLATYFCSGVMKDSMSEWGHYALAVPLYTHFTSPLRRYPDIVVHRTLAATIEAEEIYMRSGMSSQNVQVREEVRRCFTGINFDKDAAESVEGKEALSLAASKHKIMCTESLAGIAEYCNERELASRHVKDAGDKLYMWVLLKRKEVLLSEARVLGLGPRFMSIYIQKLAIERRIYYDEVEGLAVEWLEATSTLVLSLCSYKRSFKRSGSAYKELNEFAFLINPCSPIAEARRAGDDGTSYLDNVMVKAMSSTPKIDPLVFPVTIRLLSTIPVALHAVGGDEGPIDIGARLLVGSYFG